MPLIAFEDALELTLLDAGRLGVVQVGLDDAAGRVLATPIIAHRALPEFDNSAMDGYALDLDSLRGDGPWELTVAGESRAGGNVPAFASGTACRIFTGAALPSGTNTVILQENVTRDGGRITIASHTKPRAGQHIRRSGSELAEGTLALSEGARITPAMLGVAATLDVTSLLVARRPRVAVLASGDELRAPGTPAWPGSIPESNAHVVTAIARRVGAEVHALPYASDAQAPLSAALAAALADCDLLVTIGGASVGDHDRVRPSLEALGARFAFHRVSMRPGKPTAFATRGTTRILCLPGNPASATLAFHLFGVPLLRSLQGDLAAQPRSIAVPVRGHHTRTLGGHCDGRDDFLRAALEVNDGELNVRLASQQSSGAVTSFARADALVRLAGTRERIDDGDRLPTLLLSDLGG